MHTLNQTLNRISLVGIGGGLALMAALYYPLYVLLPSQYLAEEFWQTGSPFIGGMLLLVALLLVIGTGYLASSQSSSRRRTNLLWGALAGGIAGTIFFYGLGGAGAGVIGNRPILTHGLVPAENESHFIWLLSDSVTGTIFWVYSAFWLTVLTGVALGAIGGLFAPLASSPEDSERAERADWTVPTTIAQAAVLASLASLTLIVAIFSVLGSNIEQNTTQFQADGFSLSLSPSWVSFSTAATTMVLYLLSLSAFYLLIHKAMKSQELGRLIVARAQAYVGAFVAAFLPLLLFKMLESAPVTSFNQFMYTIIVIGGAINLMLTMLLLRSANASVSRLPATALPTQLKWAQWLQRSLLPTVVFAFLLSLMGIQNIAWLLLLIVTITFVILWRRSLSFEIRVEHLYASLKPTMLAMTLPFFVIVPATLGVSLFTVSAITPLSAYPSGTESFTSPINFTLADNIHNLYLAHPATLLLAFALSAILVGLNLFVVKLSALRRQQ